MATWDNLAAYIRKNYIIKNEEGDLIVLDFDLGGGRSQLVFTRPERLLDGGEEWVLIESVIGSLDEVNLRAALDQVGDLVCGGLARLGNDLIGLRHAVPLANLDVNEFERPLVLVTSSADRLERNLVGLDRF
jgi:hypothetical protein